MRRRWAAAAAGLLAGMAVAAVGPVAVAAVAEPSGYPDSAAPGAGAGAPGRTGYADSVDQALQVLRDAPADDAGAASRAAGILEAGTGQTQPEILADLRRSPPDVTDARARLTALAHADRSPAFVPEPAKAQRAIHDILAEPRYSALHQGPSLTDRLRDAALRLLAWLLDRIAGSGAGGLGWLVDAAAALALALLVVVAVRSLRWRGRREASLARPGAGPAPGRDRFAEADRLAAAGELAGAIRALAGGVGAALGDDRAWEAGPLTVRELFSRAPDPSALRPLLLAFEAAAYGDRPPDAETYRRAAAAAAPFRAERRAAAA